MKKDQKTIILQKQLQNLLEHNTTIKVERKFIYNIIKRIFDIIFATIIFPFAFVIILFFGILIKVDSKGPMFYMQTRCGLNGKIFLLIKLRSMRTDAEKNGKAQWATKDDPRITRIGKFIRKTRIDELPQLLNVFTGSLSFVGPRPERPELILEFSKDIPNFIDRTVVKPGLTGLAQVNGGYEMTPEEKLKWDIKYIQKRSVLTDVKILFNTIKVIITGHGAY